MTERTSFDSLRDDLRAILQTLSGDDESVRSQIEAAIAAPTLTIAQEMDCYDAIDRGGDDATHAREVLVEAHLVLAVRDACSYRHLASLPELTAAATESLTYAADGFTFPRPKHSSFFYRAKEAIELALVNKLRELGMERLTADELKQLYQEGNQGRIDEIMKLLSEEERRILELRIGQSQSVEDVAETLGVKPVLVNMLETKGLSKLWYRKNDI